jgi:crossover junction endodeoxyribonuclease RuvC
MKVLAFDPGYDRLGTAVLSYQNGTEQLHYSTCITSEKADNFSDRLHSVAAQVTAVLDEYKPDTVALETVFFNKNQKTAFMVAQMRGVLIYLAKQAGCAVYEFGPQAIKVAVTGHGGSDKTAVTMMVKRLVPAAPEKAHDDEYDAIAVGITCLAHHGRTQ